MAWFVPVVVGMLFLAFALWIGAGGERFVSQPQKLSHSPAAKLSQNSPDQRLDHKNRQMRTIAAAHCSPTIPERADAE